MKSFAFTPVAAIGYYLTTPGKTTTQDRYDHAGSQIPTTDANNHASWFRWPQE